MNEEIIMLIKALSALRSYLHHTDNIIFNKEKTMEAIDECGRRLDDLSSYAFEDDRSLKQERKPAGSFGVHKYQPDFIVDGSKVIKLKERPMSDWII